MPLQVKENAVLQGVFHADNVAPSLMGDFTLIRSYHPLDVLSLSCPKELYITVIHPKIHIPTMLSRKALRKYIAIPQATKQCGNLAGLVLGITQGDFDLMARSMEDVIAEPIRSSFIPAFHQAKFRSLELGAIGTGISGSGPSIFSISKSLQTAQKIQQAFEKTFKDIDIGFHTYVGKVNREGARVLD